MGHGGGDDHRCAFRQCRVHIANDPDVPGIYPPLRVYHRRWIARGHLPGQSIFPGARRLPQRTIDTLGLDMRAGALKANVTASAKNDTVLINVRVLDESAVRARDIANALSDEFVVMIRELETPEDGARPDARVFV